MYDVGDTYQNRIRILLSLFTNEPAFFEVRSPTQMIITQNPLKLLLISWKKSTHLLHDVGLLLVSTLLMLKFFTDC